MRQSLEQRRRVLHQYAQQVAAGGEQGGGQCDGLGHEGDGRFVELGGGLDHADHHADDQYDQQQRTSDPEGDLQAGAQFGEVADDLVGGVALPGAAPALQATTLVPGCYHSMFYGCTGLTRLPELPATNLASYCYAFIFADCTGITLHEDGTCQTGGIPNDAAEAMGWNTNMLAGTV